MANTQHVQFSDENGDIYYLENQTEDVRDASGKPLSDGGDLSEASVTFTADSTRTLPKSGSRFKAFCGSVLKFLSDLKTVSFSGSYNDLSNKPSIPSGAAASQAVANNCTTTAAGSVLDARQGKVLMDKANQLSSDMASMKTSFQDGVSTLYDECVDCGVTPSAKTPAAIIAAIKNIFNNRYNAGVSATKKGNATAGNVLSGKTFTSASAGVNVSGTMANRGALNWNPSKSESKSVAAGYYSGGTLSTANAYNAGFSAGQNASQANGKWKISFTGNFHDNSSPVKWLKLTDQITIQVTTSGVVVVANESFLNGQVTGSYGSYSIEKV